jgi:hypothetical protein
MGKDIFKDSFSKVNIGFPSKFHQGESIVQHASESIF